MALGDGTGWNEASPATTDNLINGDDEIRDLRIGTRIRLAKEHVSPAGSSVGGEHKAGSARAFIQDILPVNAPAGTVLASPADNGRLLVNLFGATNLGSLCYYMGGGWFDIQLIQTNFPAGCVPRSALTWGASSPSTCIVDQQVAGVEGQGLTSGTWQLRRLNTVAAGVPVSDDTVVHDLALNVFTLSAGTYRVWFWATGYKVDRHICRLRQMTDGVTIQDGSSQRADANYSCSSVSAGFAEFTLAGQKDFQLQHHVETQNNTNGGGIAANQGVVEKYCGVRIERLA